MIPDVVVVGGGIIGCSCAYYLARSGLQVHLVEKGALGCGASKAGMCHIVTWEEPEIHLKLELAGKRLYEEINQELPFDIELRRTGSLALVESTQTMEGMSSMVQRLQKRGHNCEMLSAREMIKIEPHLAPDIAGGAFFADDLQVNPARATLALATAARKLGAVIEPFTEVNGFIRDVSQSRITGVTTGRGQILAGKVLLAAGAWSSELGRQAGLEIPIQPRKGYLVVTAPLPQTFLRHKTLFSAGYLDSVKGGSGVAVASNIQQMPGGNLLLGSSRQFVGFDTRVDPRVLSLMLARSVRFFPALAKVSAIRSWAGLRPYTPDLLPIIGEVETLPGLYIAAGHEGLGITEAPITGKIISQILQGLQPEFPVEELALSRFTKQ